MRELLVRSVRSVHGLRAGSGIVVLLAVLTACSAPQTTASVVAPGTPLFASPPSSADCSKLDFAGLRALVSDDLPAPRPILTYADPDRKSLTWAGCAGPASRSGAAAASPSPSTSPSSSSGASSGSGSSSGSAEPEGSRTVDWMVRYATTRDAALKDRISDPLGGTKGVRNLVRTAVLGDAPARIHLDVHADDHDTLVLVTVEDPSTRHDAAECGVVGVPGGNADKVVDWCLRAISGQLLRT